jgi:chloramphenicol O-acetyltransferase type B
MGAITIGEHSYCSGNMHRKGNMNEVTIGKFCSIADGVVFDSGWSHNTEHISTYPFHAWVHPTGENNNVCRGDIIIGNDVWIGAEAIIMSGVTIGDGAVIGARSIITKNVKPYSIVVGNDRFVRKRFNTRECVILSKIKWWNWTDQQIVDAVPLIHSKDIDKLYDHFIHFVLQR